MEWPALHQFHFIFKCLEQSKLQKGCWKERHLHLTFADLVYFLSFFKFQIFYWINVLLFLVFKLLVVVAGSKDYNFHIWSSLLKILTMQSPYGLIIGISLSLHLLFFPLLFKTVSHLKLHNPCILMWSIVVSMPPLVSHYTFVFYISCGKGRGIFY